MTEATAETATLTEVLVRHAFYGHYGVVRIAIDDFILQDLTGDNTVRVSLGDVTLLEQPGSPDWVNRMARLRKSLVGTLTTTQNAYDIQTNHLERLGEAILEKAKEHSLTCEEYDDFAEEWGLPRINRDFEVTMTVRVEAQDEEGAIEIVRDNVSLNTYSTPGVQYSPEFSADEV